MKKGGGMRLLIRDPKLHLAVIVTSLATLASCSGGDAASPAAPGTGAGLAAPTAKSPVGGAEILGLRPTLEVDNSAATGSVSSVTYRFEISDSVDFPAGSRTIVVENVAQGAASTSAQIPSDLEPGRLYYWRARAVSGAAVSNYSTTETLRAENRGFRNGQTIYDPLTNGQTVADERYGGHFVTGADGGWQADGLSDSLDYNIPTCTSCRVEFDATNFDRSTPPEDVDQKWFSMGDGSTFGSFITFRDHIWKMHVEKRSGDGGAVKLIWRKGCNTDDSCDNTDNFHVPIAWEPARLYHFTIEWGGGAMSVSVCEWNGTACLAT
ncbi:MAG TPA: hypothetical protein VM818_02120, partial [Vicinamibacterales bacterium]|nr:hypothetical protein [Vicinamibacterales bacterium]